MDDVVGTTAYHLQHPPTGLGHDVLRITDRDVEEHLLMLSDSDRLVRQQLTRLAQQRQVLRSQYVLPAQEARAFEREVARQHFSDESRNDHKGSILSYIRTLRMHLSILPVNNLASVNEKTTRIGLSYLGADKRT